MPQPQPQSRPYLILCLAIFWGAALLPDAIEARSLPIVHHTLEVSLEPDRHTLHARNTLRIPRKMLPSPVVSFYLNPGLTLTTLAVNGRPRPLSIVSTDSSAGTEARDLANAATNRMLTIELSPEDLSFDRVILTLDYEGRINDPPQASGGLRFVRPDDTDGHIGPEGIYLTSETLWYPVLPDVLHTFDLAITLPDGWEAVTQGKPQDRTQEEGRHTTHWNIGTPSEALTLAANQFMVEKRQWQDIEIATYLFAEEAPLAPQYLDATEAYLKFYTDLLGPFPFSTFAVAENFFPSGLGMPAFTLLGQGVIRRGYTQPYSLGHEIVHSWFGNSVFNDFSKGNWVEGLTTYLSNYYYDEATGQSQDAFKTRLRMHHEYNLYTSPDDDYPIIRFHHKETRRDNAVGYQKTALVFHMLRQELGDDLFFKGVRRIITEGTGRYIEWNDLVRIFSRVSARDLEWFFMQWVFQPGAPKLHWNDLSWKTDPGHPEHFLLTATLTQTGPVYRLKLPVAIETDTGSIHSTTLDVTHTPQTIRISSSGQPRRFLIDPEYNILRRLQRHHLPPMLNMWETDSSRTALIPSKPESGEESAYTSLLQRLQQQRDIQILTTDTPDYSQPGSYLMVGSIARQALLSRSPDLCEDQVQVTPQGVKIGDRHDESPETAFIISCAHPDHPGHVLTFFFGLSPEAMTPISRLLFFYGWDSYLVFQQGRVVARGMFDPVHSAHEMSIHHK
jgi:aminopeptidase N